MEMEYPFVRRRNGDVRSWADRQVHRHDRRSRVDGHRGCRAASTPGRGRVARDEVRHAARRAGRGSAGPGGIRRQDRLSHAL